MFTQTRQYQIRIVSHFGDQYDDRHPHYASVQRVLCKQTTFHDDNIAGKDCYDKYTLSACVSYKAHVAKNTCSGRIEDGRRYNAYRHHNQMSSHMDI